LIAEAWIVKCTVIWLWIGSFIGGIIITAFVYVVGHSVSAIVAQLAALQTIKPQKDPFPEDHGGAF